MWIAVMINGECHRYEDWVVQRWLNGTLGDSDLRAGLNRAVQVYRSY